MGLSNLAAVFAHYWDLGFTSFGGPGVHVVVLRRRFVDKLKWVDDTTFVDLFALGNALPGPGSTQLAFSIAVVTHGVAAGLLGFMLWSLPGALGMAGLGAGVAHIPDVLPPLVLALLTGLNAAAVGLIALAAVQLATASATDRLTLLLLWLTAAFGICYHAPWMYPTLIAAGGITTLVWDFRRVWWRTLTRKRQAEADQVELAAVNGSGTPGSVDGSASAHSLSTSQPTPSPSLALPEPTRQDTGTTARSLLRRSNVPTPAASAAQTPLQDASADPEPAVQRPSLKVVSTPVAIALLFGFVLFLTVPLATRAGLENAGRHVPVGLDFFCNMVIAGTIIFGGGPVVIPLLRDYVVVEGWVSSRDFLLVFAILQAFPGPNFNFAVALGVLAVSENRVAGAVAGFVGIFGPGIFLKLALLPLYSNWRDRPIARSVIRGLNATASGLVFTAVWQLFLVGYIYQPATGDAAQQTLSGPLTADPFWAVVSSGAFVACRNFSVPPWAGIAAGGLAGLAWYGVTNQ